MNLNLTIKCSLFILFVGTVWFYFCAPNDWIWFLVGGGLALINILFAAFVVRLGFKSLRNRSLFLALLLVKSFTFVMVVALVVVFLKPKLLPFTSGVGLVIVGAIGAALL